MLLLGRDMPSPGRQVQPGWKGERHPGSYPGRETWTAAPNKGKDRAGLSSCLSSQLRSAAKKQSLESGPQTDPTKLLDKERSGDSDIHSGAPQHKRYMGTLDSAWRCCQGGLRCFSTSEKIPQSLLFPWPSTSSTLSLASWNRLQEKLWSLQAQKLPKPSLGYVPRQPVVTQLSASNSQRPLPHTAP